MQLIIDNLEGGIFASIDASRCRDRGHLMVLVLLSTKARCRAVESFKFGLIPGTAVLSPQD